MLRWDEYFDGCKWNINSQKYIEILENNLWPVIACHFPDRSYIFQDDNAPVHMYRSYILHDYMIENQISTTSWLAQSQDCNIVENIWLKIKRDLESIKHSITTHDQLIIKITCAWQNISANYIHKLYSSIPGRLQEVIHIKGHLLDGEQICCTLNGSQNYITGKMVLTLFAEICWIEKVVSNLLDLFIVHLHHICNHISYHLYMFWISGIDIIY